MIKLNNKEIKYGHFPDKTILLKENVEKLITNKEEVVITWLFETNEELSDMYRCLEWDFGAPCPLNPASSLDNYIWPQFDMFVEAI